MLQLVLMYVGFISLGLPDAIFGIAWPTIRDDLNLLESAFGLTFIFLLGGFLVSSIASGALIERFGVGLVLSFSTAIVAVSLFGFALAPNLAVLLLFDFLIGIGSGAADASLNTRAAGRYSSRQNNWMHAAFGFGVALGPLAMTAADATSAWRETYSAVAGALAIMAALFFYAARSFNLRDNDDVSPSEPAGSSNGISVLRDPAIRLQIFAFALYFGVETAYGQWSYTILTEGYYYSEFISGIFVSSFWFMLFIGRFVLGFFSDRFSPDDTIRASLLLAGVGAIIFMFDAAIFPLVGMVVLGLALAPIYPMLMFRTPRAFSPDSAPRIIGYQVSSAMIGGVAIPAFIGVTIDIIGIQTSPYILAALTAVLVLVGLANSRHRNAKAVP